MAFLGLQRYTSARSAVCAKADLYPGECGSGIITDSHQLPSPISVPCRSLRVKNSKGISMINRTAFAAQPPLRRPDAAARGHPDDPGGRGDRQAARHFRARPHHRGEGGARELEGVEADLRRGIPTLIATPTVLYR
jgi:hypothetical protein